MCRAMQELEANARPETIERSRRSARRGGRTGGSVWARSAATWRASSRTRASPGRCRRGGPVAGARTRCSAPATSGPSESTCRARTTGCWRGWPSPGTPLASASTPRRKTGGVVPQFNVVAEMRGTELPDEYIPAERPPRLVARGDRRDGQRDGHDRNARGDADPAGDLPEPAPHDPGRSLGAPRRWA